MNLSWLLPQIKGIPVLMYHKVWPGQCDELTITPDRLREQWLWMKGEGYQPLALNEFLSLALEGGSYPEKSVLITFDDGYLTHLTTVQPLLKELKWKATCFIIADTLTGEASYDGVEAQALMRLEELKQLDTSVIQLAVHGYAHENFGTLSAAELINVMERTTAAFEKSGLQWYRVLAYPYGARPADEVRAQVLKTWMADNGFSGAFRIGNQVSAIPAPDPMNIRRIDIKGTDTVNQLKIKLKKGKLRPF